MQRRDRHQEQPRLKAPRLVDAVEVADLPNNEPLPIRNHSLQHDLPVARDQRIRLKTSWKGIRMYRILGLGLSCALLALPSDAFSQQRSNPAEDRDSVANGWQFNYEAARTLAQRTNKPLMVVLRCVP